MPILVPFHCFIFIHSTFHLLTCCTIYLSSLFHPLTMNSLWGHLSESSSSSQGISLKRWAVSVENDVASDSRCRTTCLFQASGFLLYFEKIIRSEVWHFLFLPPRFVVSRNHCCPRNRIPTSVILSESSLLSIIYLLMLMSGLHTTSLRLFLIFLNPACP